MVADTGGVGFGAGLVYGGGFGFVAGSVAGVGSNVGPGSGFGSVAAGGIIGSGNIGQHNRNPSGGGGVSFTQYKYTRAGGKVKRKAESFQTFLL
jgi:hypothetical protein